MSRNLSYRVWDNEKNEYSDKPFSLDQYGLLYIQDEDGYWEEANEDRFIIEFDTGFKDKNGKEIYEGGIVRYDAIDYVVVWTEFYACFEALRINNHYEYSLTHIAKFGRVIGNIHENPELLADTNVLNKEAKNEI